MKRKRGAKNGLYQSLMDDWGHTKNGAALPENGRKPTKLQRYRLHDVRAMWRRTHQRKKYEKAARQVRSVRKKLRMNQMQFAAALGVSPLTVRRWENAYGHLPSRISLHKMKELGNE